MKEKTDNICKIFDFSDISPEIEIQKQIVCYINKDCCIEEVVQMPSDFYTEPHNTDQLIKYTQNAEKNRNCIIACENKEAYMDINMATNVSDREIGASKGEKQMNIGIVQNYETDFDINSLTEHSDTDTYESSCETELSESSYIEPSKNENSKSIPTQPLSGRLKNMRKNYHNKKVHCKFCEEDVSSRNFVRHLSRHHTHEKELKDVLDLPVKSKKIKQALDLLKGSTNFELYLKGTIRPKKQRTEDNNMEYYPCIYCKVLYSKRYLYRHAKICPIKKKSTGSNTKSQHIALSQTAVACALDTADVISKLHIKEQITCIDIYQTAKVVKLLIMMEKGIPTQHKGKSLSEIELDMNKYVDDKNQRSPHTIAELEHTDIESTGPERSSNKKREESNNKISRKAQQALDEKIAEMETKRNQLIK
ncbi:hypothetical protein JTB14_034317 [Gonioctena quinquepunctata]|nr:hypothetical protein JTB14_034317 [Gonioctena quinquepunctata]